MLKEKRDGFISAESGGMIFLVLSVRRGISGIFEKKGVAIPPLCKH
jgi:hypothetical protein